MLPHRTPGFMLQLGSIPHLPKPQLGVRGAAPAEIPPFPGEPGVCAPSGRERRCPARQCRAAPSEERSGARLSSAKPAARACREALGGCSHLRSLTPLGRTRSLPILQHRHGHRGLRPHGAGQGTARPKAVENYRFLFFFSFLISVKWVCFFLPCLCRYLSEDIFKRAEVKQRGIRTACAAAFLRLRPAGTC